MASSMIASIASPAASVVATCSLLLRRQRRLEQEAGGAEDGVHRRLQLVAHRGEEAPSGSATPTRPRAGRRRARARRRANTSLIAALPAWAGCRSSGALGGGLPASERRPAHRRRRARPPPGSASPGSRPSRRAGTRRGPRASRARSSPGSACGGPARGRGSAPSPRSRRGNGMLQSMSTTSKGCAEGRSTAAWPSADDLDGVAAPFEQARDEPLVGEVVVGDEHVAGEPGVWTGRSARAPADGAVRRGNAGAGTRAGTASRHSTGGRGGPDASGDGTTARRGRRRGRRAGRPPQPRVNAVRAPPGACGSAPANGRSRRGVQADEHEPSKPAGASRARPRPSAAVRDAASRGRPIRSSSRHERLGAGVVRLDRPRATSGPAADGVGGAASRRSETESRIQKVPAAAGLALTPIGRPSARQSAWRSSGRGRCRRSWRSSIPRPARRAGTGGRGPRRSCRSRCRHFDAMPAGRVARQSSSRCAPSRCRGR